MNAMTRPLDENTSADGQIVRRNDLERYLEAFKEHPTDALFQLRRVASLKVDRLPRGRHHAALPLHARCLIPSSWWTLPCFTWSAWTTMSREWWC